MDTPLPWHIPLSHYSKKVRWALDYKGIAHRRRIVDIPDDQGSRLRACIHA
jgi:glutathione S-transferase